MPYSRRRLKHLLGSLTLVAICAGCVSVPKIHTEQVGFGDLPLQTAAHDMPPYDPAAALPTMDTLEDSISRPAYLLGPQDRVVVNVWGRADLGSQVPVVSQDEIKVSVVGHDGKLSLPFLGALPAAGKTVHQLRGDIERAYSTVIENPQIEVTLFDCGSKSVEVAGSVERPRQYFLCNEISTIGELLALAGGPDESADTRRAVFTRAGQSYHLDYGAALRGESNEANILLEAGDRVFVPSIADRVVYIFGEVQRHGVFPIPEGGLTILGALGQARGLDSVSAAHKGIYLVRLRPSGYVTYRLKMEEIIQGPDIQLADEDRIFVQLGKLERWDRWWRKALPFTTVRTDIDIGGND